jgi:hypothetical protein
MSVLAGPSRAALIGAALLAISFYGGSCAERVPDGERRAAAALQATPGALARPSIRFSRVATTYFELAVPAGWTLVEDEEDGGALVRSRWQDPRDPRTSVSVEVIPAEETAPAHRARALRAATSRTPGYVEHGLGPATLAGRQAWRWDFAVPGERRVDFLLNECETGYAVLGSAPPARFNQLRATFANVARSLQPVCEP